MEILEYFLLKTGFDMVSWLIFIVFLFALSGFLGFFARIIKIIFKNLKRKTDKFFMYLFTVIFYICAISNGIKFFVERLEVFSSDGTFFQKFLSYIVWQLAAVLVVVLSVQCYALLLQVFFYCSGCTEVDELNYKEMNLLKGIYIMPLIPSLALIISIFRFLLVRSNFVVKIFIWLVIVSILSQFIILFRAYIKRFFKGKEKFLIKGYFLNKNNEKGFFKFVVRDEEKNKDKVYIHYHEQSSDRKIGLDFYISKKDIYDRKYFKDDVFYGDIEELHRLSLLDEEKKTIYSEVRSILSLIFFDEDWKLRDNKIFRLHFSIPKDNIVGFYYKDKNIICKDKNSLWKNKYIDEIKYQPYSFLLKLVNYSEQIKLDFLYLETNVFNKQEFFVEEYGKNTKITNSFAKINNFFQTFLNN